LFPPLWGALRLIELPPTIFASGPALRSARHRVSVSRVMEGIPAQGRPRMTGRGKKNFLPGKTNAWKYESGLTPCALVPLREYLGWTAAPGSRDMVPIMAGITAR
jgi:hypothetical protein